MVIILRNVLGTELVYGFGRSEEIVGETIVRRGGGAWRFRAIQDLIHIRRYRQVPGVAGRGAATPAAAEVEVSRGRNKKVGNFKL